MNDWDLCWMDTGVTPELVSKMRPYQKINHFPGMSCLSKKNYLQRNLSKMAKRFEIEYSFYPKTWVLPNDFNELRSEMSKVQGKTYIVKPHGMSQGNGIYLTKGMEGIGVNDQCIVQEYITNPYLIDGLKFDLRIYALVYGCDPLRIYMFEEGIARFSTDMYVRPNKDNIDNRYMHLTNYAINKVNKKFTSNSDPTVGHKRNLASVWSYIDKICGSSDSVKRSIREIVVKTLCAVQPKLSRTFRSCQPNNTNNNMCFEILGFDILLEDNLRPWLLEVNHSPSFNIDTPFDYKLKTELIKDTIKLLHLDPFDKMTYLEKERERVNSRTYARVMRDSLSKKEREQFIHKAMIKRDNYELMNSGRFIRIYPDIARNAKYPMFLEYANNEMDQFHGIRKRTSFSRSKPYSDLQLLSNPYCMTKDKFIENKHLVRGSSTTKRLSHNFASDRLNKIASIYGHKLLQEKSNKNSKIIANAKRLIAKYKVMIDEKKLVVLRPQTTMIKPKRATLKKHNDM